MIRSRDVNCTVGSQLVIGVVVASKRTFHAPCQRVNSQNEVFVPDDDMYVQVSDPALRKKRMVPTKQGEYTPNVGVDFPVDELQFVDVSNRNPLLVRDLEVEVWIALKSSGNLLSAGWHTTSARRLMHARCSSTIPHSHLHSRR